jgi:hypothetical protein
LNVTDLMGRSVLKLRFSADDQGIAPEENRLWTELASHTLPNSVFWEA